MSNVVVSAVDVGEDVIVDLTVVELWIVEKLVVERKGDVKRSVAGSVVIEERQTGSTSNLRLLHKSPRH